MLVAIIRYSTLPTSLTLVENSANNEAKDTSYNNRLSQITQKNPMPPGNSDKHQSIFVSYYCKKLDQQQRYF